MEDALRRRDVLKMLGTGGATAALTGCAAEPPETLMSYVVPPDHGIPGVAAWYATVCRECPAGCGMVVRTREGRAVKVEGNRAHPVNQGHLCARGQASLQGLYNPDRIPQPLFRNQHGRFDPISWDRAEEMVAARLAKLRQTGKVEQVAFLTSQLGGALDSLIGAWMAALGATRRITYEPFAYEALRASNRITFGRDGVPTYDLETSTYIISFGADFLETWLSPVAYARGFGAMRRLRDGGMGRFTYVGPRLSLTAANADDWVQTPPGSELFLALGMLHVILAERLAVPLPHEERQQLERLVRPFAPEQVASRTEVAAEKIARLARTFAESRPSLALGGGIATSASNATATCVAINLLNYVVGNIGQTVRFAPSMALGSLATHGDLLHLIAEMQQGRIPLLFCHGANPRFNVPESTHLRAALHHVPLVVSFSSFLDETTAEAHLILPDHTPLESWGDYTAWEGVYGLMQPAMRPLFQTKAMGDTLLSLAQKVDRDMADRFPWRSFDDYLRDSWRSLHQRLAPHTSFDTFWDTTLGQGGLWEEVKTASVHLSPAVFQTPFRPAQFEGQGESALHLVLYPSPGHFDGRGANRPWLQELPDPMTKIVWDNWLEIHPHTAQRLGITEGDVVQLMSPYGRLEIPVHVYAWIRPDVVAMPLGQGHTTFGRYAASRGGNPMVLLPPQAEPLSGGAMLLSVKVDLLPTGRRHLLVSTAGSDRQEGRGMARAIGLSELVQSTRQAHATDEHQVQMYPPHSHPEHRWGMVIDLNACIGCAACEVACQAENNLPVVGQQQVARGREMSWLRIERYFEGQPDKPDCRFVPMLCQHCDQAPCEPVCPVYATYHNPEGLNVQIYNRCVGTRYCSNNCPYKVRRFNWFDHEWPAPLHLQLNPDVSVRSRGVMEKCTFCVQRIREVKDRAKDHGRPIRDGDIVPACVQTCPTQALVFGDLKDPQSRVATLARDLRRYQVLEHLNTQPAITYLKKIKPYAE